MLKEQERKARTRTLISLGALVEKAGLSRLDTDALYGALMTLERDVGNEQTVRRWRKIGREGLSANPDTPADPPAPGDASSDADTPPLHVVSQAG